MALDETKDNDAVFEFSGINYIIDKNLMAEAQPVKIDFGHMGFKIDSGMKFEPSGCSGCGTTSSCCS